MYVYDYKLIMWNARASSPAVQSFLYQFCRLMDPVVNVPIDGLVNNQYKSKTLPLAFLFCQRVCLLTDIPCYS